MSFSLEWKSDRWIVKVMIIKNVELVLWNGITVDNQELDSRDRVMHVEMSRMIFKQELVDGQVRLTTDEWVLRGD